MSTPNGCKVDDVIETYGIKSQRSEFDDVHENLLSLWKGKSTTNAQGYRPLTEWFNKCLLKCVYDEHGRVMIGSRLDNEFLTLTGEDNIARAELIDDIVQSGINVDRVIDNMVSWSTMRRHLVECLDGEKKRHSAETNWERESVDIATDRLIQKVSKALSSYGTKDQISGATDANISVQIQLSCPECPTRRTLPEAHDLGYVCDVHLGDHSF